MNFKTITTIAILIITISAVNKHQSNTKTLLRNNIAKPLSDDVEQKVREAFAAFDKDNSGFLEKKEALTGLNTVCKTDDAPPKQVCDDVKKTLEKFDTNNDGKISLNELMTAVKTVINSLNKKDSSTKLPKSNNQVKAPSNDTETNPQSDDDDDVEQKVKEAFAAFDKDNSGFLEKKEAIAGSLDGALT
jgi:Ca2+-binding EF-hand superfamily protein